MGKTPNGFTLIELMVSVAIVGILIAVAIPNFTKFQARSRQAEVKENLKAAFTAEHAYFQLFDTYSNKVNVVGFSPERGNRYCYDFGGGVYQTRSGVATNIDTVPATETGVEVDTFRFTRQHPINPYYFSPTFSAGAFGNFTMVASGNIDNDPNFDQWSISSISRTGAATSSATTCAVGNTPGGEPCVDFDDTQHVQ